MSKMTIVKWAVAAMLAVPAVPMFAKTVVHKTTSHARHHTLVVTAKKHRTLHHKTTKHTALSTASKHKTLTTSARAGRKMSATLKHTAKPAASHPQVEAGHQPTIDGMHT